MYGNGSSLLSFFSSVARQLPTIGVVVVGLVVVDPADVRFVRKYDRRAGSPRFG